MTHHDECCGGTQPSCCTHRYHRGQPVEIRRNGHLITKGIVLAQTSPTQVAIRDTQHTSIGLFNIDHVTPTGEQQ
jgi:hypothetical protein